MEALTDTCMYIPYTCMHETHMHRQHMTHTHTLHILNTHRKLMNCAGTQIPQLTLTASIQVSFSFALAPSTPCA